MKARSIRQLKIWGWRCVLFWLLGIVVLPLTAADKRLAPGQVPAAVARGQIWPLGRLPGTNQLHLALCLPVRNAEALTNLLATIYDPGSPEFHHYLKPAEFASRFGPTTEDYAAVMRFAATNGLTVTGTHSNRLVVDVTGPVSDVERALHVRLNFFRHPREPRNFFAPDKEPTVDANLPLVHVSGLNNFSRPQPHFHMRPLAAPNVVPRGGSGPYGTFLGNDFRQAYAPGTALTGAGQNVGLLEFDGFYDSDITDYAALIGLTNHVPARVVVPVDGGFPWPGGNAVEVALDIEMILAMSPGVSNIFVYEAPNDDSLWVDLLSRMADDDLAQQLSCSWGTSTPEPAAEAIFQQMAVQGQSFFNASGDSDAFVGTMDFPSDSPTVTEVGGTYLGTDAGGNYVGEAAWNRTGGVGSSGGISATVAVPVWQLGVDMTANHGSTVWRNVPDVALTADDVYIICFGQGGAAGGTSCAAPLWAGFTALINQQAAQLGQPPVGFLNPALYALGRGSSGAAAFHDITIGNNINDYSPSNFFAVPGFDLCTGWGTPNGTNLINALTTPEFLGVTPQTVFATSGLVGGPFPQSSWTMTLTNAGAANLAWSLGGATAWLAVSASGGSLAADSATNISLQLKNPNSLPTGSYLAILLVTNLASSRVQTAAVRLDIGQSIVQNGGFETGDFTGWTLTGNTVVSNYSENAVATAFDVSGIVHSGNFGVRLGERGTTATLAQTVTTLTNQLYLISCWLANPQAGSGQIFKVKWNGTNFINLTNPPAITWSNVHFVASARHTNTVLQVAARNDANYFGFDDVSVTPVPPVAFTGFSASGNAFQLAWNSLPGLNYQVQYKTNLAQANWLNLGSVAAVTNAAAFADTNSAGASCQRFYRLVLWP